MRWFSRRVLALFPTCEIQDELSHRRAVRSYWVEPFTEGSMTLPGFGDVPVSGPCVVTVNWD